MSLEIKRHCGGGGTNVSGTFVAVLSLSLGKTKRPSPASPLWWTNNMKYPSFFSTEIWNLSQHALGGQQVNSLNPLSVRTNTDRQMLTFVHLEQQQSLIYLWVIRGKHKGKPHECRDNMQTSYTQQSTWPNCNDKKDEQRARTSKISPVLIKNLVRLNVLLSNL